MAMVHLSRGGLEPPGPQVRCEVAIIVGLARAVLGPGHPVEWERYARRLRRHPRRDRGGGAGFDDYNRRVREPDGF